MSVIKTQETEPEKNEQKTSQRGSTMIATARNREEILNDSATKPDSPAVAIENIPDFLRDHDRWVLWAWKLNTNRRWTKVLKRTNGHNARSNDSNTWTRFDDAVVAYQTNPERFAGIGFVLGDQFVGIDLDDCIVAGELMPEHSDIVHAIGGYWEVSPTGTGLKSIAIGKMPVGRNKTPKGQSPEVEMYDRQYFTITGQTIPESEEDFSDKTVAIAKIHTKFISVEREQPAQLFTSQPIQAEEESTVEQQESYTDDDIDLARECLVNMSPDMADDRETWINAGIAAKGISRKLWPAWNEFSRASPKYNAIDAKRTWSTFSPRGECGLGTLIHMAEESGWQRPSDDPLADMKAQARLIGDDCGTANETSAKEEFAGGINVTGPAKNRRRLKVILGDQAYLAIEPIIAAIGSLTDPAREVFQQDERLVEIIKTSVHDISISQIKDRIDWAVECQVPTTKGYRSVAASKDLAETIMTRKRYGNYVRPLEGVIVTPNIMRGGEVIQTPGYDPTSRLYYRPSVAFPPVAESPSREDANAAGLRLLEILSDTPFATPSDHSAWLAMLLTIIGRSSFLGNAPLFGLTANTKGSGKGTALKVLYQIAVGKPATFSAFPTNEDASGKLISTLVIAESSPVVFFDNVSRPVGGSSLDGILTADSWADRKLGKSEMISTTNIRTVFAVNGNNLRFVADTARRVLPIRMMTDRENPADRNDWKHAEITEWALKNRPSFVADALTMLKAYIVAGKPLQPGGEWGSYGDWSRVIRGSIVWAGLADPMATRHSVSSSDNSRLVNEGLIVGLKELANLIGQDGKGMTTREIADSLETIPGSECPTLRDVLAELPERGDKVTPRLLGGLLSRFKDNRIGDERIVSLSKARGGYIRWGVESAVK